MTRVVSSLIIYPVKSLAGINTLQANAMQAGFEHDRRWMLLDENNVFMTQRDMPQMALFIPEINEDSLSVHFKNESISFDLKEMTGEIISTKVWDDNAETQIVSKLASEWFSDQLGRRIKLVKIKSEESRSHYNTLRHIDIPVSLADGYPYLLTGEESLNNLNSKLEKNVPMNRFRPNIVVTTTVAHEEDQWENIAIGEAGFKNMKPCGRCTMVTIDQSTGLSNNETLKVLNTYRKSGNSVLFGTNMMCTKEGKVTVGDVIHLS